ncbi:MAG: S-methyl-5'-thioadenosine phosphorylase [Nanoarchaeota archaeon]|nr:S-methyl-5'-thioadenosine phosphorylase [Nanoarchaeota archaeon]
MTKSKTSKIEPSGSKSKSSSKNSVKIGIIGGSGLDDPKILKNFEEKDVNTFYGKPTSKLTVGKINGVDVVIIARHGKRHTIPPTQVNFRANIKALQDEGVTHIIATTACGSLRRNIGRGEFVILDQFIDFTRHRPITFYDEFPPGGENAKHTPMSDPFSKELRHVLIETAKESKIKVHEKGTVVTIEGPRFSTRAESKMFSMWGADVINMSVGPEAILANEAGIPYAAVAMATDYDCLFDDVPPVSWEEILKVFGENVNKVKALLTKAIPKIK